jgi:hypothetical protein
MIYSAIFDNYTILADYSEESGDFGVTLTKIFRANKQPLEFYMVTYLNYDCFFLHSQEYTFSTISNQNLDNEKILMFLQDVKEQFLTICKTERDNLILKCTNIIRNLMGSYQASVSNDKFEKIDNTIETIRKEKLQIVSQVLEKEVLLETIVNKSDNLKKHVKF